MDSEKPSLKNSLDSSDLLKGDDEKFQVYKQKLRNKLSELDSCSGVIPNDVDTEIYEEEGLPFSVNLFLSNNLAKKDVPIAEKNVEYHSPFLPPFDPSLLVDDDLNGTHRIFLNKFPLVKGNVVIATRELEDQYTHLKDTDVEAMLLMINIFDGFSLFNGGLNAGATQPHKHVQLVPYLNLQNTEGGIFSKVKDKKNLININNLIFENAKAYQMKQFSFKHILITFNDDLTKLLNQVTFQNSKSIAKMIHQVYVNSMEYLEIYSSDKITINYSIIICKEFMLLVPRRSFYVTMKSGKITANSLVYSLSFYVNSMQLKHELIEEGLTKVLANFGYNEKEPYSKF